MSNMSSEVVEKSSSPYLGNHNGHLNTQWLEENLEDVDQSVKAMLDSIKDAKYSLGEKDGIYENKPDWIAHVEHLHFMYKSLAEQYNNLSKKINAEMQNTDVSHLKTPNQKMSVEKSENQGVGFDLSPNSGHGISDFSDKGGSEISSSTSDSESEAFYSVANKTSNLHVKLQENESYSTLLRRVTKYEEELKESNRKLGFSENEISNLKDELEKLRGVSKLVDDLKIENELAQGQISVLEDDLETKKLFVLKLQGEITDFEAMVEIEERLVLELKETILEYETDAYEREQEIKKLNIALFDSQRIYTLEKSKLNCDISIMSEQLTLLKARAEESEMRNEFLENEIRQCEAEKIRTRGEIENINADIHEKCELMEALNKDFDKFKVKYDMLIAEKDRLDAEMSSRGNVIRWLEENLTRANAECVNLTAGSDRTNKLVGELRVRVAELEREVEKQRVVISERGEEKREAIRQLCFSIDHYRTDYQELKKAVVGQRRAAVW